MNKVIENINDAVSIIQSGMTIGIGGFFAAGVPRLLLKALIEHGATDLTLACGAGPLLGALDELNSLVENRQIKKLIDSYGLFRSATKGAQHPFEKMIKSGEIELEVYPMGTLSEKYRAAGAGIPALYLPTGVGSMVAEEVLSNIPENRSKKEVREINGRPCVLEYALKPDVAFVHAHSGDSEGNLVYRKTARNFNHVIAMAADISIAEVENLVDPGDLNADMVHTPGIFIKKVVKVPRIEFDITNL